MFIVVNTQLLNNLRYKISMMKVKLADHRLRTTRIDILYSKIYFANNKEGVSKKRWI